MRRNSRTLRGAVILFAYPGFPMAAPSPPPRLSILADEPPALLGLLGLIGLMGGALLVTVGGNSGGAFWRGVVSDEQELIPTVGF